MLYLQTQQTPNPLAQVPEAVPPLVVHSELVFLTKSNIQNFKGGVLIAISKCFTTSTSRTAAL